MKRAVYLVLIWCAIGGPLAARTQPTVAGAVQGTVTDEQGRVIPGATIEAVGPAVAGRRETTTDAAGSYHLIALHPGEYTVIAGKNGFGRTRTTVVVRAGLTVTIDHVLRVASVDVAVDVVVNEPLFDAARAVQATNLRGALLARLPLSSRLDWADFLLVTPGIVSNDGGLYYAHGSSFDSHVLQLDGVDLAATRQNANQLIRLNPDTFDDVQVKTAGIEAATPLGTGIVISMASRSGTDSFRGVETFTIRPRHWSANNNPGGTTSASSLRQLDLSLGGPLRPSRAWFFGTYRYLDERQSISRTPAQIETLLALAPEFLPFTNDTSAHIHFTKVTASVAFGHQIFAFHQADRTPSDTGRDDAAGAFTQSLTGGHVAAAGLSSVWGTMLARVVGSFNDKGFGSRARGSGPAQVVYRSVFSSSGVLAGTGPIAFLGNTSNAFRDESNTWTVTADATYHRSGRTGAHEVQAGASVQRRRDEVVNEYVNDGFAQEQLVLRDPSNAAGGTIAFQRSRLTPANLPLSREHTIDLALYVRDTWRAGARLTVDAGVRADVLRRDDRLFNVRMQRSIDVGPRIGVNYALAADSRRHVRASWGRVHDALSTNSVRVGDDTAAERREYDLDLDGVFETVFEVPRRTMLSERLLLDPDRSQPYVDEWTVGFGQRLPWSTSIDVSLISRSYRNRTAFVDTNGVYEGERFVGYRNPSVNEIYQVTNNRWNWPVYTGIEVRGTRQTGALQWVGGYTRGFQHLAGTWQPRDPAGFIQPDSFSNDRGIGSPSGGRTPGLGSLSGFADASAPQWRSHLLRTALTAQGPWDLLVATTYAYQSGVWSGPIVARVAASDPRFGDPLIALPNGRVVQNPLATTVRFAHSTRGDGQFALPGVHMWNVRVGRSTAIPGLGARVEVAVDLFNLVNLGRDQLVQFGGNQLDSPNFGKGTNRQLPRSVALSTRLVF